MFTTTFRSHENFTQFLGGNLPVPWRHIIKRPPRVPPRIGPWVSLAPSRRTSPQRVAEFGKCLREGATPWAFVQYFPCWWLNQPLWKICTSKRVHLPQFSGENKNIWGTPPPSYLNFSHNQYTWTFQFGCQMIYGVLGFTPSSHHHG